ncbi:MAG: DsrE family protein [Spirochaetaceae bacterium]|nr:DsrE family protein [Spirochaetaceae bacterium]
MKKIALFAFNGDPMCFVHVLINALELKENGNEVALVIEGSATKLVKLLSGGSGLETFKESNPKMFNLLTQNLQKVKEAGIVSCVCQACANQMDALEDVKISGLPLCGELKGHPSMNRYIESGFDIISF